MGNKINFKPNPDYRLMDQVREVLRYYHYSYSTEQAYSTWIVQYVKFYGSKVDPMDMGKKEVERFLSYLTEKKNVAAATQSQAKFYKKAACHTFRHSFVTHLLEAGTNIRAVQKLMGHTNVKTTEIYTYVMKNDIDSVKSPLDLL